MAGDRYTLCLPEGAFERDAALIQRKFTRPLTAWALLVALVCAWCTVTPARAQGGNLDVAIVQATQLSPDQKSKVEEYVNTHSKNLAGAAPDIKKDRNALLKPLEGPGVSTAFRLEYSGRLVPILTPLIANDNDLIVINAVVIAADLATQGSVDLLANAAAAAKPSIRYEVAYALRRTFEALRPMDAPTMQPEQIQRAIDLVATRLEAEADAIVIDGLILAGLEAAKLTDYRARALSKLSKAFANRCKSFSPADTGDALLDDMLRAGKGVRDVMAGLRPNQIDQASLRNAAELGGQLVAFCIRAVESQNFGGTDGSKHAQIAGAGETVVLLAVQLQTGTRPPEARGLSESLKSAQARFLVDAKDLLGPRGPLMSEPFKFAQADFPLK